MARRKKEPEGFHREQIATAAGQLFQRNGIEQTSMDDIAKTAGYSKATLYAYFKNKEEIVSVLALESMKILSKHLVNALEANQTTRDKYNGICQELVTYQRQYPYYFSIVLDEIAIDFEHPGSLPPVERETYEVGEQIICRISEILTEGMRNGQLRDGLSVPVTAFMLWSSLSGIILMAAKKKAYIKAVWKLTTEDFLSHSFDTLYRCIEHKTENRKE